MAHPGTGGGSALLRVFDHVYVINLRTRPDRRAQSEAQFRRIGLSHDNPAVTVVEVERPTSPGGFGGIGVRGCFESHVKVLDRAVRAGHRTFLIVEDDADFCAGFAIAMPEAARHLSAGAWDMLYSVSTQAADENDEAILRLAPDRSVRTTHFVGFSGRAAARALPYLRALAGRPPGDKDGGPMHVDGAYSWFRRANPDLIVVATREPLAIQRPSRSDIGDMKWIDRIPLLRRVVGAARAVKGRLRHWLDRSRVGG